MKQGMELEFCNDNEVPARWRYAQTYLGVDLPPKCMARYLQVRQRKMAEELLKNQKENDFYDSTEPQQMTHDENTSDRKKRATRQGTASQTFDGT